MKGLILKDLYTMRSSVRILAAMMAFYIVIGMVSGSSTFFASFIGVLCIMMTISAFSYDQYSGWNLYGACLPTGRRQMVRARYLLALIMTSIGVLLTGLAQLILLLLGSEVLLEETLPTILGAGMSGMLLILLLLPVIYRFGVEKGRLVLMVLGAGMMGVFLLLGKATSSGFTITEGQIRSILWGLPVVLIVGFWVSYRLSCHFFEAKDL